MITPLAPLNGEWMGVGGVAEGCGDRTCDENVGEPLVCTPALRLTLVRESAKLWVSPSRELPAITEAGGD